jgi:2-amino-4-hydroxy-6-hydroxymethyldihydropteridine diphosphokinase
MLRQRRPLSSLPNPRLPSSLRRLKEGRAPPSAAARAALGSARLDLDIILWSGGSFAETDLIVPHPAFRQRDFVLRPLVAIAPHWRDPLTGLHTRQLLQRFHRPSPVDRRARHT